jgi:hypothetical protein
MANRKRVAIEIADVIKVLDYAVHHHDTYLVSRSSTGGTFNVMVYVVTWGLNIGCNDVMVARDV